jgi:serine/threonine protein phosphatase 1
MRWIIGDVHGMRLALEALLAAISKRDSDPQLIFAGDYVNRGPDSRGVLNLLLKLTNASFVRGNHDDILDVILHGTGYVDHPTRLEPIAGFRWFMQHGLKETLISYGADEDDLEYAAGNATEDRVAEVMSVIPAKHRTFFRELKPLYEEPDLFVAHAAWDVDLPDECMNERLAQSGQDRLKIIWGRYQRSEIMQKKPWRRMGYFGHTPVQSYEDNLLEPLRGPSIVLLDTGAALGSNGRLSAVCAETGECVQVHRSGKPVEGA